MLKWLFGETTIFHLKIWNHPIEATIYQWMFQVQGIHIILCWVPSRHCYGFNESPLAKWWWFPIATEFGQARIFVYIKIYIHIYIYVYTYIHMYICINSFLRNTMATLGVGNLKSRRTKPPRLIWSLISTTRQEREIKNYLNTKGKGGQILQSGPLGLRGP